MGKLIASMNMTLDGVCDHRVMNADAELHNHYTELLGSADLIFYGRTTYQLMEDYWPALVANPSGEPDMDAFAAAIDAIEKIVFSTTMKSVSWKNSTLYSHIDRSLLLELKNKAGGNMLIGSPSLIVSLTEMGLVDEYQISVQPKLAGVGMKLFEKLNNQVQLELSSTKFFQSGAVTLYYQVKH